MKATFAAAACLALAVAVPALASSPTPALRLASTQPLIVRGVHFRSHERVRVTRNVGGDKWTKIVRASSSGAFKVSFAAPMAIDPCLQSGRVTALGSRGSEAAVKLPQQTCLPGP